MLEQRQLLAADIQLVKDINPSFLAGPGPGKSVAIGSVLYFTATSNDAGEELWKSDGTAAGTVLVKDIRSGASDSFSVNSELVNVGGTLYFTADNGTNGEEQWNCGRNAADEGYFQRSVKLFHVLFLILL